MVTASIVSADKMTEDDANRYLSSGYKGGVEGVLLLPELLHSVAQMADKQQRQACLAQQQDF